MAKPETPAATSQIDDALAAIRGYLHSLKFGSIAITIHGGHIVQLDVTEKRRLKSLAD